MFDHRRSVWLPAGEPWTAPASNLSQIGAIVIHYIGTNFAPKDARRWMLQTHRDTMSRPQPYAHMYNAHIDVNGHVWEGRGVEFRNAANGSATNASTWSIVFAVDGQSPAGPVQVEAARRLIAAFRGRLGRSIPVRAHRDIGSTQCPGEGITAQIRAGVFEESRVERIAGNNRFETAALVSRRVWPAGAPVVYVASGRDYPDALSAGMFTDGPVLLTAPDVLPAATRREIERLKPQRIVIVGGTAAVSMAVEQQLAGLV